MKPVDQNLIIEAFTETGEFGKFQIYVFVLALVASFFSAPVFVDTFLLTYSMAHRCRVPLCDANNAAFYSDHVNYSLPWDATQDPAKLSSCNQNDVRFMDPSLPHEYTNVYGQEYDQQLENIYNEEYGKEDGNMSGAIVGRRSAGCAPSQFTAAQSPCQYGWVYDGSLFTSTAVKDFELVCSRSWLAPLASSMNMLGIMVGAIVAGNVGDRWGRKIGFLFSVVLLGGGGAIAACSPNYPMFLAARLLTGAGGSGVFLAIFVLITEIVGPRYRTMCGVALMVPFALGEAHTGVMAYFLRNWRYLQLAVTIPALLMLSYMWLLPESVRWLVLQGRNTDAVRIIKKAAKINRATLTERVKLDQVVDTVQKSSVLASSDKTMLDLLRSPRLRRRSFNLFFCWAVCALVYYGLSSISGKLAGNFFVNFIITMLVEIPSYVFTYAVLDRVGRKATLCFVMIVGGIASFTCGLLSDDALWLKSALSLTGKFGIASAFAVVYIYSSEIFPTEYRGVGVGSCSMFARVGGILAPFVASLGAYYEPLPLLIFGTLSVVSGCLIVLLPETLGCELPQTIEDSENFARNQPICYFAWCSIPGGEKEVKDEDEKHECMKKSNEIDGLLRTSTELS